MKDYSTKLPRHESVLRPLLESATERWAYELQPNSDAFFAAEQIVTKHGAKYEINAEGESILGHEYFWNASGGMRGTIVLLLPVASLPFEVFAHCQKVFSFSNPSVGHTPSAFRFAKEKINADKNLVACLLPRNNGFEWIDFYAHTDIVCDLFNKARATCSSDENAN